MIAQTDDVTLGQVHLQAALLLQQANLFIGADLLEEMGPLQAPARCCCHRHVATLRTASLRHPVAMNPSLDRHRLP